MTKKTQAVVATAVVLAFSSNKALLAEVTACVSASESVKGRWVSMAQAAVGYFGNDKAKAVAFCGDGDGVPHSKELEAAVVAGLPVLSRTLLETARADTAEESKEAREAAQANVSTYIRRVRQSIMDILEGKTPAGERTPQDKLDNAVAAGERFVKALGKVEGEYSMHKVVLGYLVDSLENGTNLKANIIGMAAMINAQGPAK